MSEESGWMMQPPPMAPAAPAGPAPQQGIPPGFERLRGLVKPAINFARGVGGMGNFGGPPPMAQAPEPQWSAASYAPSQMLNRPVPPSTWGNRPMPQQPGNTIGQMPQQGNPMVRALRGQ